ncbi:ATP-binding cassette sub-family C member Sur isoform X2 [Uranotaenia lowii]|uniref:ATP-binding cassette sub-family C member Sur isoform X2 n=1 Tax=Uranotaenia lowii TaxID=190385 RepID=UPI002478730C|nr:ATP-binding cassette sub-family C member Sur isoform X2 [Uranotaenia lowii]
MICDEVESGSIGEMVVHPRMQAFISMMGGSLTPEDVVHICYLNFYGLLVNGLVLAAFLTVLGFVMWRFPVRRHNLLALHNLRSLLVLSVFLIGLCEVAQYSMAVYRLGQLPSKQQLVAKAQMPIHSTQTSIGTTTTTTTTTSLPDYDDYLYDYDLSGEDLPEPQQLHSDRTAPEVRLEDGDDADDDDDASYVAGSRLPTMTTLLGLWSVCVGLLTVVVGANLVRMIELKDKYGLLYIALAAEGAQSVAKWCKFKHINGVTDTTTTALPASVALGSALLLATLAAVDGSTVHWERNAALLMAQKEQRLSNVSTVTLSSSSYSRKGRRKDSTAGPGTGSATKATTTTQSPTGSKMSALGHKAPFLSRVTFWWIMPLLWRGYREPLELENLGWLPDSDTSRYHYDQFLSIYQRFKHSSSLWRCYALNCWQMFLAGGALKLLGDLCALVGPFCISNIVDYIAKSAAATSSSAGPLNGNGNGDSASTAEDVIPSNDNDSFHILRFVNQSSFDGSSNKVDGAHPAMALTWSDLLANGWFVALLVLVASLAQGTFSQASTHIMDMEGIRLKNALQGLVYRKTLLLSSSCFYQGPSMGKKKPESAEDDEEEEDSPCQEQSQEKTHPPDGYITGSGESDVPVTTLAAATTTTSSSSSLATNSSSSVKAKMSRTVPISGQPEPEGPGVFAAMANENAAPSSQIEIPHPPAGSTMLGQNKEKAMAGATEEIKHKPAASRSIATNDRQQFGCVFTAVPSKSDAAAAFAGTDSGNGPEKTDTTSTVAAHPSSASVMDLPREKKQEKPGERDQQESSSSGETPEANSKHAGGDAAFVFLPDAGTITNLMSDDAFNVMSFVKIAHYVWAIPLKIGIVMYLLYRLLGVSSVIGSIVCVLTMTPLQFVIGKMMSKNAKHTSKCTDERLRRINEVLLGIKLIKLSAWEAVFREKISNIRRRELKHLDWDSCYWTMMMLLTHISSVLITFVTVTVFTHLEQEHQHPSSSSSSSATTTASIMGETLASSTTPASKMEFSAARLFASLALFNQLTVPLFIFPITIPIILSAVVSTRRLEAFLSQPEVTTGSGKGTCSGMAAGRGKRRPQQQRYPKTGDEGEGFSCSHKMREVFEVQPMRKSCQKTGSQELKGAYFGSNNITATIDGNLEDRILDRSNCIVEEIDERDQLNDDDDDDDDEDDEDALQFERFDLADCVDGGPPTQLTTTITQQKNSNGHGDDGRHTKSYDLAQVAGANESRFGEMAMKNGSPVKGPSSGCCQGEDIADDGDTATAAGCQEDEEEAPTVVSIRDGRFQWGANGVSTFTTTNGASDCEAPSKQSASTEAAAAASAINGMVLKIDRLDIPEGKLTIIVGRSGSGKSSLLAALLKEINHLSGEVCWSNNSSFAYVPQRPWLLNGTVRDNILFGEPFRPKRYRRVLQACALEPDIQLMPDADWTEIGERGIRLSGGQRQRIVIARALYAPASVVIMDDPLSSLDNEVATFIFDNGIRQMLRRQRRTALMVTQRLQLVFMADYIIAMEAMAIRATGTMPDFETNYPQVRRQWEAIIAQERSREAQSSPGKTARERWKLFRNVSRISFQRNQPVEECYDPVRSSDGMFYGDGSGDLAGDRRSGTGSGTAARGPLATLQRSTGSSIFGSRFHAHDLPMVPIDDCCHGESVQLRRHYSSRTRARAADSRAQRAISDGVVLRGKPITATSKSALREVRSAAGGDGLGGGRYRFSDTYRDWNQIGFRRFLYRKDSRSRHYDQKQQQTNNSLNSNTAAATAWGFRLNWRNSWPLSLHKTDSVKCCSKPESGTFSRNQPHHRNAIQQNQQQHRQIPRNPLRRLLSSISRYSEETETESCVDSNGGCGDDVSNRLLTADSEERQYGQIPARMYWLYLKSCGLKMVAIFLLSALAQQGLRVYTDFWLQNWTDHSSDWIAADEVKYNFRVYAVLSSLCILLSAISFPAGQLAGSNARRRLHRQLLASVLKNSIHFFQTVPLGRIMNRLSIDIAVVDKKIAATSQKLLQFVLLCLCAVLINSVVTPYFILLTIPICGIYYVVQKFYRCSSRELQRIESITYSPVIAHFSETIEGLQTIRAYRVESRFTETLFRRMEANNVAQVALNSSNRWLGIALDYLGAVIVFVAILSGLITASLDPSGTSPSLIGLAINYALLVPIYLNWVVKLVAEMEMYVGAVERIKLFIEGNRERLAERNRIKYRPVPISWPQRGDILFEDISLRYEGQKENVITNLHLAIPAGQRIGICGRTGSGKSSLALALFGALEVSGGRILIDDVDIGAVHTDELRSRLSIIPQESMLFGGSLRENLDPRGHFSDLELWNCLEMAQLKETVIAMDDGLDAQISEDRPLFSAGQRQLLCLARAVLRGSVCLVLDEATSSLDTETEKLVLEAAAKAFKGRTVLTIAHRLHSLFDYDRVIVLERGQIVEDGCPRVLRKRPGSKFAAMLMKASEGHEAVPVTTTGGSTAGNGKNTGGSFLEFFRQRYRREPLVRNASETQEESTV